MLILVTGASGLLGSNLTAAAVQQSWSVLGTWHEDPVEIPGASTISLDVSDRAACVAAATSFEPEVIVHAATEGAPGPFEDAAPAWATRAGRRREHAGSRPHGARAVRAGFL